jgi:hypothetical protein
VTEVTLGFMDTDGTRTHPFRRASERPETSSTYLAASDAAVGLSGSATIAAIASAYGTEAASASRAWRLDRGVSDTG